MDNATINDRQRRAGFSIDERGHLFWEGSCMGYLRRWNLNYPANKQMHKLIAKFNKLKEA